MVQPEVQSIRNANKFTKALTGIKGIDSITYGGLPAERLTLIVGGPGCGKTVFGLEFLINGALLNNEKGIFFSFETSPKHLLEDFQSMNLPLEELIAENKLRIEFIELSHAALWTANFNLDKLFLRIIELVDETGAKRIVLDTIEKLFSVLPDNNNLRIELERLFDSLRERNITTIVSAEQGDNAYTQRGFEAYISDCVIVFDHRIESQISKRRMRIVKYRGSKHGKDEYPFVIGEDGISVFPISSEELEYEVSNEQINMGVSGLDEILDGKGIFRTSSVIVTGKSGTGKSLLAASFAMAACERGEKVLYLAFEESPAQIIRNMRSVNVDLQPCLDSGLLRFSAFRPTFRGLEEHLILINSMINLFNPDIVIMDPISSLIDIGSSLQVKSMLTRVFDIIKAQGMTLFVTSLTPGSDTPEHTDVGIALLMDTWIALDYVDTDTSRETQIYVVKSRGTNHSTNKWRYNISPNGLSVSRYERAITSQEKPR